jgi:hypothetical protein
MPAGSMNDEVRTASRTFSIGHGGPFYRLASRIHLIGATGAIRVWRLVALAWMPVVVDSLVRWVIGARLDPIVFDLSVHARLLVSLPLLVVAERLLEPHCRAAIFLLYDGNFADRAALDRIVTRAERLRDSPWIEAVFVALAVVSGQLVIWGISGATGLFHGIENAGSTPLRIWYAGFGLPLVQFLALRWLWRWGVWSMIVVQLARLPLAAIATHPDGAAGLRFLSAPITAFAVFEAAFAFVLAGAWWTQLLEGRVAVPSLVPSLVAYVVIAFVIACAPLLLLTTHLYRAQRQALLVYNPLALEYVRRFHGKWIEHRTEEPLLGAPDIQSLADLGGAYQTIATTGMFVFSSRRLAELGLGAIVPMLPLVITVVPVEQLLRRLGSLLFGGLLP